ncbi:MAG: DMT family transporter [Methanosarcinaceae archaeon]|jgi:drug/metabolite transporter (DMT)-like permease|nr:DMT family transporter [Methanosarcinaceae archaeon]
MASKKAYVMIILAVILWSSTFTFIQIGLKEVTPIYIGALRFVIASMLLIVYVLIKFKIEEIKNFTKNNFIILTALGIFGITIPNIVQNIGMLFVTASMASILQNSSPAFTLLLASIFLNEYIGFKKIIGLIISFIGVVLISIDNGSISIVGENYYSLYGNILIIISALCYSIYFILSKKIIKDNHPALILAISTVIGTILLSIVSIGVEPIDFSFSKLTWFAIIMMAIFGSVISTLMYFKALKEFEVSKINFFTLLIPIFAIIQAHIILGDVLQPNQIVFGALILFGIWIAQKE